MKAIQETRPPFIRTLLRISYENKDNNEGAIMVSSHSHGTYWMEGKEKLASQGERKIDVFKGDPEGFLFQMEHIYQLYGQHERE